MVDRALDRSDRAACCLPSRPGPSRADVWGLYADSEVFYLVARIEGRNEAPTTDSLRMADRDIRALERRGVTCRGADWRLAGEVKAAGGCLLADAVGVALAYEREATGAVGADEDLGDLPIDVTIERIRDSSVCHPPTPDVLGSLLVSM